MRSSQTSQMKLWPSPSTGESPKNRAPMASPAPATTPMIPTSTPAMPAAVTNSGAWGASRSLSPRATAA